MAEEEKAPPAPVPKLRTKVQVQPPNLGPGQGPDNGHLLTDENNVNIVTALFDHNLTLANKLSKLEEEKSLKCTQLEDIQAEVQQLKLQLQGIKKEGVEIEEKSKAKVKNDEKSEEIQQLLEIYEELKSDEKKFKEMCNKELERLQGLVPETESPEVSQREVKVQLEKSKARVEAGRIELGVINRKLAMLKRQIEQVPNRTELREYRLRFSELYNQVSATHRQTKQFFSLYNSLEDTKRYLEKELSLLNSIVDSYQEASQSSSGKEDFLRQLSVIHDGMKETCSKVDQRNHNEKLSVEKLQHELQRLLDQKVSYEKCLKELEAECKRNDKLLAELKEKEASMSHKRNQ